MTEMSVLKNIKKCMPKMRLSRQKTLSAIVVGCLNNPKGKLSEIGRGMHSSIKLRDRVKRIVRFLGNKGIRIEEHGEEIFKWLMQRQGSLMPVVVLLDWSREHGENVMMLSLQWGKRSIPFYWEVVCNGRLKGQLVRREKGAIALLRRWHPEGRITVIADRGFSRLEFYEELKRHKIDYIIRIQKETYLKTQKHECPIKEIRVRGKEVRDFKQAQIMKRKYFETRGVVKKTKVKGQWSYWYIATSLKNIRKESVASYYASRMGIEASFRDLKSTLGWGYQARLEASERVARYLLILVVAMICSLEVADRKIALRMKELVSFKKAWRDSVPVSFVQLGLWIIQKLNSQSVMIHPRKVAWAMRF